LPSVPSSPSSLKQVTSPDRNNTDDTFTLIFMYDSIDKKQRPRQRPWLCQIHSLPTYSGPLHQQSNRNPIAMLFLTCIQVISWR